MILDQTENGFPESALDQDTSVQPKHKPPSNRKSHQQQDRGGHGILPIGKRSPPPRPFPGRKETTPIVVSLQTQLAQLTTIVQASRDAIIRKNLDGIITGWNRGAERLYGYSEEEMLGQAISLIVPDHLAEEVQQFMDQLRKGENIPPLETVRRRRDGSLVEIQLQIFALRGPDGEVTGGAAIAREVTEIKFLQRKLRQVLQRRDEQMEILASELKQPLDSLLQVARALNEEDASSDDCDAAREAVLKHSEQIARLLRDLGLFA